MSANHPEPGLDDLATLRAVWDAVADALALSDPEGRVLAVNNAYCSLYGFTRDQLIGHTFALIFPPEARAQAELSYRETFERGEVVVHESAVRSADQRELVVEARASFIERDGQRVAMLSTIRDITDQRRAEAERDAFVAAASHDLLQPLALIRVRAQLLLRREEACELSPERLETGVRAILAAVDNATGQLVGLVDAARLRAGQPLVLQRGPADVSHLVRELVAQHQASTDVCDIRCELPPQPLVGYVDEARLRRVISNLLGNAIKYSPNGGEIAVRLTTDAGQARTDALLEVRDHGVGIPMPDLPYVFDPYRRGSNVAAQTAGSGLGLASALQIARQHGGSLEVESKEGHGSRFTLRLPLSSGHP